MPAASSSYNRRSINTSRGRPSRATNNASSDEVGGSAIGHSTATVGEGDEEDGDEEEGDDDQSHTGAPANVQEALLRFDQESYPLSEVVADTAIKSHTPHWNQLKEDINRSISSVTETAERRAETLASRHADEQSDEGLAKLDEYCRMLLDIQEEAAIRTSALESIRKAIADKEKVTDAAEKYRQIVYAAKQRYSAKTQRKRYGQSKQYDRYIRHVWDAAHVGEPMPHITDMIPAEEGDEDDEGEEIAVFGGSSFNFKCPLTLQIMVDPVRSTVCPHAFERTAIEGMLGSATKPCPVCQKSLRKSNLRSDPELAKECKSYKRRLQQHEEQARTQQQSALLD